MQIANYVEYEEIPVLSQNIGSLGIIFTIACFLSRTIEHALCHFLHLQFILQQDNLLSMAIW